MEEGEREKKSNELSSSESSSKMKQRNKIKSNVPSPVEKEVHDLLSSMLTRKQKRGRVKSLKDTVKLHLHKERLKSNVREFRPLEMAAHAKTKHHFKNPEQSKIRSRKVSRFKTHRY